MIVISGALVLVAVVLLGLGLAMTDLGFVHGSIGVSVAAFVFLVLGIRQHRGEPLTADGPPAGDDATPPPAALQREAEAPPTVVTPGPPAAPAGGSVALDDDLDDDDLEPGGGPVLVVSGRSRYHVEGCPSLTGEQAEEVDVLDAQEDGFTACDVCRPDEVLEELYGPLVVEDEDGNEVLLVAAASQPEDAAAHDDAAVGDPAAEPVTEAPAEPVAGAAPATTAPATTAPATTAPATTAPAATAPAATAPAATAPDATAPAATAPAATAPADQARVVVAPGRGRFHAPSCRFVRDVAGTTELSRAQAEQSGLRPCGVCRP